MSNVIRVIQGSQPVGAVVVKKGAELKVQSLTNVVSTDLQDGYTLVYDSETQNFITQQIPAGAVGNVDGGTY